MINIIAGFLIGLVFIVESCVWYVRSMSAFEYRSKAISTSNIVMYATRVLLIGYQIILNYRIESGGGLREVLLVALVGMIVALVGHLLLFYNKKILSVAWSLFLWIFKRLKIIEIVEYEEEVYAPNFSLSWHHVVIASAFSTIALLLVYITPQVFAALYASYRLTLSSIGQVISFLGMVVTLFFLDPALFKMHDKGGIRQGFSMYLSGRLVGLAISVISLIPCIYN